MYFSARNSNSSANCIPTSAHRLSLCVLRNAKLEDIQQMQELQSRQSESLSLSLSGEVEGKDLMGLYGSGSEFSRLPSSPPQLQPQHQSQLLGRMALGDVDEERENWAAAPAHAVASTSRATKAKRFGYVPNDPDLNPRPAAHGHSHTRSASTVGSRVQQELELEEGRGEGEGERCIDINYLRVVRFCVRLGIFCQSQPILPV
ncbi:hypothetical protein CPB84DRAFT_657960 [Gymnopilus junonius]|uniref:Uncharacterized protein n=1 Tax=Gymnopilus junonius TaxID=109634 RepID=A0A9P5NB06_GYMJU|nr:hypothetical protein CPB84DRAFT_657960 [Gymnopilus junonius]